MYHFCRVGGIAKQSSGRSIVVGRGTPGTGTGTGTARARAARRARARAAACAAARARGASSRCAS